MLIDELKKEKDNYTRLIAEAEGKIRKLPEGNLRADVIKRKKGESVRYYRRKRGEKTGKYLKKGNEKLVQALAQKEYLNKTLKVLKHGLRELERFDAVFDPDALKKTYSEMQHGKKELVEPFQYPDEEYARIWQAKKYTGGSFEEGEAEYYTKRGDRVRSKSEQIIADRLHDAGVPYRYEYPLIYNQTNYIYTDFTVLNKRTRVMFRWEHFGRMDDPKYRRTFFWKQSVYAQYGYIPGVNYICTFEDNANPLDTRVVDKMIRKLFL